MKSSMRLGLRAVLYQEDERWIARSLEFDLLGDGNCAAEALDRLAATIPEQIEFLERHGSLDNLFRPAPAKFFEMFAKGRDVPWESSVGEGRDEAWLKVATAAARAYAEPDAIRQ